MRAWGGQNAALVGCVTPTPAPTIAPTSELDVVEDPASESPARLLRWTHRYRPSSRDVAESFISKLRERQVDDAHARRLSLSQSVIKYMTNHNFNQTPASDGTIEACNFISRFCKPP